MKFNLAQNVEKYWRSYSPCSR